MKLVVHIDQTKIGATHFNIVFIKNLITKRSTGNFMKMYPKLPVH